MLKLYNTLSRKKQDFKPLKPKTVGLYTCGPTVYDFAHIGNLRTYIFEDLLKRILLYNNYKVKHIINITDVGHLTSDADTGEDKLEKGALREKKTVWQIADFYTKQFKKDLKALNILEPSLWLKATDTIKEQIDLIKILEKKGFTYQIEDGLYFDASRLKNYGILWGNKKPMELKAGARVEMVKGKKNLTDFALWKLTPPGVKRQMEWNSPWGRGFPGWHTECVAMNVNALGIPFDVHCGGIDHIPIHHTNEIAQAQAAYEKNLANFWLHSEFLNLTASKMSKSKGNIITLAALAEKGLTPLSFRYLCLTAHYRAKLNFSWKSLTAAQNGLDKLYNLVANVKSQILKPNLKSQILKSPYRAQFLNFINDDLNTPKALALIWQMINDKKLKPNEKYALVLEMDKVFGLGLEGIETKKEKIPKEIFALAKQRKGLRQQKKWQKADEIRKEIEELGYQIEDTNKGTNLKRKCLPNNK